MLVILKFRRRMLTAIAYGAAIVVCPALLAQPPPASPVVAAPVVAREVAEVQTFVGTVKPSKTAIVGSAVDGRVVEFLVDEGDRVTAEQPLARLLTTTIHLELAAAEAELELRRQELVELENGSRPEEITQANARMQAAEARAGYLRQRRIRIESLVASGRASSIDERDQAVSDAIEAEQLLREAKAAHEMAVQGPRKEKIAQARARAAIQEATVERLKDQITKHTIVSRFDGYVTAEHTEIGQWVQQGDPIVEVAALETVEVLAYVAERHVPFVKPGMAAEVIIPALPGPPFPGTVVSVVPRADPQARTFPVKVKVLNKTDDAGPILKSGMYAQVMLPTGSKQMANLVLKDALVLGGPQPTVFVVDQEPGQRSQGKARPVKVQLGVSDGSWIQAIGPLNAGELVVVQGNERLRPGQIVNIARVETDAGN